MSVKDAFHLKDIDKKSVPVSGVFGWVGGAGGQVASRDIQGGKRSKTDATVTGLALNSSIDAGVSAGSQYVKDGKIAPLHVATDTISGQFIGGNVSITVQKRMQTSSFANKLYNEAADEAVLENLNSTLLKRSVESADKAIQKAKNYGARRAIAAGSVASGIAAESPGVVFGILNRFVDQSKKDPSKNEK